MADAWKSNVVEFKGGLIGNLPELQQSIQAPGSARKLMNFEPALTGGYRRIEGFSKYSEAKVPAEMPGMLHATVAAGGTEIIVVHPKASEFQVGLTLKIGNDATVYTIATSDWFPEGRRTTLTITPALTATATTKSKVTLLTTSAGANESTENFVSVYDFINGPVAVVRPQYSHFALFYGTTYSPVLLSNGDDPSVVSSGTTIVIADASALTVSGLSSKPNVGDTFTISGVNGVYTVYSATDVVNGQSDLIILPELLSAPAVGADITWFHTGVYSTSTLLANQTLPVEKFINPAGHESVVMCFGGNYPLIVSRKSTGVLTYEVADYASDIEDSACAAYHKNQLFFSKNNIFTFSAPYNYKDFSPSSGAGNIRVNDIIVGMKSFRDELYIFGRTRIFKLTGNTSADFVLQPVTDNVGCADSYTIQEIGGDIMFLSNDGLRLLSATERIGDINLASVSRPAQRQIDQITAPREDAFNVIAIRSLPVRKKSQYRMFRYDSLKTTSESIGLIAAQTEVNNNISFSFSETVGIQVYSCDFSSSTDMLLFTNNTDPYVYVMDSGSSFDGEDIEAVFQTPYLVFDDARLRKTFYKITTYTNPESNIVFDVKMILDFDEQNVVQPDPISVENDDDIKRVFETPLIGSGFSASFEFKNVSDDLPFSFDSIVVEYSVHDRR